VKLDGPSVPWSTARHACNWRAMDYHQAFGAETANSSLRAAGATKERVTIAFKIQSCPSHNGEGIL